MAGHVTSDGLRLSVEIDGDDAAPTAVMVHGLAGSVELNWRANGVIDRLTTAGLRTVAFDLRGHGRSDAPPDEERYGDARMADDLTEIVAAFADPTAILVGYSMGAALSLLALEAGLHVGAAVIGAAPTAVLGWSAENGAMRDTAVAALRGTSQPDAALQAWLAFLDATGQDRKALAAVLARHQPVVEHWGRITVPCTFVAGDDDVMAASLTQLAERVPGSHTVTMPGDHFTAPGSPQFAQLISTLREP
jgi:pimeloyl-ACP methyl ester carboxylesterase